MRHVKLFRNGQNQAVRIPREWELPHEGNLTGTPRAYRPAGSTLRNEPRQPTGGDYEAWSPGG